MRINFWCGRHVLDGWYNVDAVRNPHAARDPELLHAAVFSADGRLTNPLPLRDNCADEIQAIHAIEHVFSWETPHLLAEWHRLLKPGGLLVLEMPDIVKCAKNLVKLIDRGDAKQLDSMAMKGLYGEQSTKEPWMTHRYGWTPKTLTPVLQAAGFTKIREAPTQWHPIGKAHRDFRVEARRA